MKQVGDYAFIYYEAVCGKEPDFVTWVKENYKIHDYKIQHMGSSFHVHEYVLEFTRMEDAMAFKIRWLDKDEDDI